MLQTNKAIHANSKTAPSGATPKLIAQRGKNISRAAEKQKLISAEMKKLEAKLTHVALEEEQDKADEKENVSPDRAQRPIRQNLIKTV